MAWSRNGMKSLKAIAHNIRIDAHTVWMCARDPKVPLPARLFGLAIAAYALSPIDLIPDFIPILGLLDDALLVPLGIWLFMRMVPAEIYARHRIEAETASQRPISRIAASMIIIIWLALALWIASLMWSMQFY
jgi:uncharacterized membrane protein YkvA (DUF1232 family)